MNNKIITKSRWNILPPNKIIFIIIGIGLVVGVGGIFGYLYFEDQQKQLQSKLDAEQKKAQQLESQKKQEELKAQQVQQQLQQASQIQTQQQQQLQQQQQNAAAQQARDQYLLRDQQFWTQQKLQQQQTAAAQQRAQAQAQLQQQQAAAAQQQQQAQIQQQKDYYIKVAQSNAVVSGLINGNITYYSQPLPSYVDPSVQKVINYDINAYDGITIDGIPVHRVYDERADIQIEWVKDYGTTLLGEAIYWRHVQVGLGNDCGGVWEPFNGISVERVFTHEMGHAFGFAHSKDPNNIMYPTIEVNHIQGISESILCNDQSLPAKNMQWDQNYQLMTQQERNKIWNLFHNSS